MDIVTHCRVPRYLHNDLPLGNPLGPPGDREAQMKSVSGALRLAAGAQQPVVEISDTRWPGDPGWKQNYNRIDESNAAELRRLGEENRRKRAENKGLGLSR